MEKGDSGRVCTSLRAGVAGGCTALLHLQKWDWVPKNPTFSRGEGGTENINCFFQTLSVFSSEKITSL